MNKKLKNILAITGAATVTAAVVYGLNVLDEKNHVVIAFKDSYDHVEVGCQVVIQDMKTQEKKTFKLLGKYEADPYATPKIISDESPLGKALVGKKVGELANFEIKNSKTKYRILSITSAR